MHTSVKNVLNAAIIIDIDWVGYRTVMLVDFKLSFLCFKRALESLQSYCSGRSLHLISVLFSQASLAPAHPQFASLLDGGLDDVSSCTINDRRIICYTFYNALSCVTLCVVIWCG